MTEFEITLLKELKRIGDSLEKLTEEKGRNSNTNLQQIAVNNRELENIADEIQPFEPALARLLLQYAK